MSSPAVVQADVLSLHAADNIDMQALLDRWVEHGWLRGLDAAFARFLWTEVPQAHPLLILAAALASHQLGRGHACLDLVATLHDPAFALSLPPEGRHSSDVLERPLPLPTEVLAGVDMASWQLALNNPLLVSDGSGNTPLVRKGSRLYLRRYWRYEQDVRNAIDHRLSLPTGQQHSWSVAALRELLDVLFAKSANVSPDWQKLACALAARSAFSVITGGPGTGKTTTVVTLLALLQALALGDDVAHGNGRALRIRLAAPTGKAAARLSASIALAIERLPLTALAQARGIQPELIKKGIPDSVTTLHRLLGSRPDSRHFRHHAANPLALDVLVIDEASMVDLEMMAAVLAALPPTARIILLGDKDQLASVEAGAVLGQLCHRASGGHYTPLTTDWLQHASGQLVSSVLVDTQGGKLDQAVVMLRHSHRFAADSGIDTLAQAVNGGDVAAVAAIWKQSYPDLNLVSHAARDPIVFRELMLSGTSTSSAENSVAPPRYGYRYYLDTLTQKRPALDAGNLAFDDWAKQVLEAHAQFQVLCAVRSGAWGVEGLNQRIAAVLHKAGHIPAVDGWYVGRPVLVVRNDYSLGLMNGDIGITLELPGPDGVSWLPRIAFPDPQSERGIKWVLPSRLQAVETVYALTVHKSQGSEFSHTVLILPENVSPVLTRELLYTGITRARARFTMVSPGPASVLTLAVQRRVLRVGGLISQDPEPSAD
ncbi:MAG: exodeoxyribonuclease V subunit alpha [Burkholderiaceae bacterium]|nr:exodeoxyribonuclease V subunit alpha [Burkholderiaceae bacterium]